MPITPMTVTINGGFLASDGLPMPGSRNFSQLVAFGDSVIDTGYFFTHIRSADPAVEALYREAVSAGGGLPTDPGRPMNTTIIADAYGLTAIPIGMPGGTNYAASGATVTGNQVNPLSPSIVSQIEAYLADNHGVADPNALYYLAGGGNSARVASSYATINQQGSYMIGEAHAAAAAIEHLWSAGARRIVINDLASGSFLGLTYSATLWQDLEAAGVSFTVADAQSLVRNIIASPSKFGIENVVRPPSGPFTAENPYNVSNGGSAVNPAGIAAGWAGFATRSATSDSPDTYLFADDLHLSAAGQRLEAEFTVNAIDHAQPRVSQVLTATPIIFDASPVDPATISYQWQIQRDGDTTWRDVSGANDSRFIITADEVGHHLRVISSYQRQDGSFTSAVSASTLTVTSSSTADPSITAPQVFHDTPGRGDVFHGGSGLDTAIYSGLVAEFTVAVGAAASSTVTGSGATDHLGSVERLQFVDGVVALDLQGHAGDVYRLYKAAFDRTPDTGGLSYWVHGLDSGLDILSVTQGFVNSSEFRSVYGADSSNAHIVDLMYRNVLGRPGEPEGTDYWVGNLDRGLPIAELLQGFAVSSENHGLVDPLISQGILLDKQAFLV